jgi:adhesin transport system outer membrane protein
MTLQDAVNAGVLKNPEYNAVAEDSLAVKAVLRQARAQYLPSIDLAGDSGPENIDSRFIHDSNLWRSRTSLTLTQLLFDGWGTANQVKRISARVESSVNRAGETAEQVALDTVESYLDILRQRDLLAIARANVDRHVKIQDTIAEGVRAGTMTQGDMSQAAARLAQARATVASTEESLHKSETFFSQKTGSAPGDLLPPDPPHDKLPASADEAVRQAMLHSPTVAAAESDAKAATAEQAGARAALYPRVNLEATTSTADNFSGEPGNYHNESVLAVMKWNLYRGGADKARQSELLHRRAAARARRDAAARQLEKDVRDTWAGMVAAAERAKVFGQQVEANEIVASVYFDQFNLDRRTLLDLLDAQNELFMAVTSKMNALYAENFAVYRVLALQGRLLDALGLGRPREARLEN